MTEKDLFKLQNGSDVRGIALDGVEGEHITLTPDDANIIAAAFTVFLSRKLEKPANELRIAIGHDSRLSAEKPAEKTAKKAPAEIPGHDEGTTLND